eukprot:110313_1
MDHSMRTLMGNSIYNMKKSRQINAKVQQNMLRLWSILALQIKCLFYQDPFEHFALDFILFLMLCSDEFLMKQKPIFRLSMLAFAAIYAIGLHLKIIVMDHSMRHLQFHKLCGVLLHTWAHFNHFASVPST